MVADLTGSPQNERGADRLTLRERNERLRAPARLGTIVADISNDADDLASSCHLHQLTDGVSFAKIFSCRGFVEDDDALTILPVGVCEPPPFQQRHMKRFEVVGRDLVQIDVGVSWERPARNYKIRCYQIAAER